MSPRLRGSPGSARRERPRGRDPALATCVVGNVKQSVKKAGVVAERAVGIRKPMLLFAAGGCGSVAKDPGVVQRGVRIVRRGLKTYGLVRPQPAMRV